LAACYGNLGEMEKYARHWKESERFYRQTVAIREKFAGSHSDLTEVDQDLGIAYRELAEMLLEANKPAEAHGLLKQALASYGKALETNPDNLFTQSGHAATWDDIAQALAALKRPAEALQAYRQALALQERAHTKAPDQIQYRERLSRHYQHLSRLHRDLNQPREAALATQARAKLWPANASELYHAACEFALCIPLVSQGKTSRPENVQAERDSYADQALQALGQALAHGFSGFEELDKNRALDVLRSQHKFQELLATSKRVERQP
jgi:tetratricopeptide (TPR) repeat protein